MWNFLGYLLGIKKERKKIWLAPVILVLLILGLLIVFGGSSAVAPFIPQPNSFSGNLKSFGASITETKQVFSRKPAKFQYT